MSGIPAEIPGGKDYKKNPGKKSQEDLEKSLEKLQEVILKELQEDLLEESEQNFQKKRTNWIFWRNPNRNHWRKKIYGENPSGILGEIRMKIIPVSEGI